MSRLIYIIVLLVFSLTIKAQTDTAFWFAAPEVTENHGDRPIFLRFTALDQQAVVNVYQPLISPTPIATVTVPANSSQSVQLTTFISQIENSQPNTISNKGIYISATNPVTAYYEVANSTNTDIFSLKGNNALGTSFLIPSQNNMSNGSYSIPAKNGFDIVATENNTQITITPTAALVGRPAGVPFTITLNRGETFSCVAEGITAASHIGGTVVTANKLIAITLKDDSIINPGAPCLDIAGDQLVPVSLAGNKFITLPGYLNNPSNTPTDWVYIMATEDNTVVTINGANVGTINKAATLRQPSQNNVFYIETNKPVLVWHISGFGCELGGAVLPQIECTGSRTVGVVRGGTANEVFYMNILVQSGGEGSFTFNGNTTTIFANQFTDVPFSGGAWKYARIQLNTSQLNTGAAAIIKNSSKEFHLSVVNGGASTGCRYGYFSDFSKFGDVALTTNSPLCEGTALNLVCNVSSTSNYTYQWTGPNGFTSTQKNVTLTNIQLNQAGTYTVTITKPGCSSQSFSTNVVVNPKPVFTAGSNSPICAPTNLQLNTTLVSGATYAWSGPNGFSSNLPNPVISNTTAANSGTYNLVVTANNCTATQQVNVTVTNALSATANTNSPICEGQNLQLNANANIPGATFTWTGPNGFTAIGNTAILNAVTTNNTGTYNLTVSATGCSNVNTTVNVVVNPGPGATASINKTLVCEQEAVSFSGNSPSTGVSFAWVGVNGFSNNLQNFTLNNLQPNQSGKYYLKVTKNGCTSTDSVSLSVLAYPNATITGNNNICNGSNLQLNNANAVSNTVYAWVGPNAFAANTQNIVINNIGASGAGWYKLTATNNICTKKDSVLVQVKPSPVLSSTTLPAICGNANAIVLNQAKENSGLTGVGVYSGTGVSNGLFNPSQATVGNNTISYTYTANNGCIKDITQTISVLPYPVVNAGGNKVILEGNSVTLNASSSMPGNINWSPASFLTFANTLQPIAKPNNTIKYTLTVTASNGCKGTDTAQVKVLKNIKIPNCFTPNGDGINDVWVIDGLNQFTEAEVKVFNRQGAEVYNSKGYNTPWNGTINGKKLPMATYYYVILLNDGFRNNPFTGWVQILY
jgi:gliding motility-associated-like protein